MKRYILPILILIAVTACQEDEVAPDRFSGSWSYSSGNLSFSFSAQRLSDGTYNLVNRKVVYPSIPEDQQVNNNATCYDKFKNGYGKIEIQSRGPVYYYVVLIYNRFRDDGNLDTYDIIVQMPGEEQYVLQDQVINHVDNM